MFEFSKLKSDNLHNIVSNFNLIKSVDFDVVILGSSERGFGFHREIHIWITSNDYENANLMILLAYIILGHKQWNKGCIKIFALYPEDKMESEGKRLSALIESGRLPISQKNIEIIPRKGEIDTKAIVCDKSKDADLTIVGFRPELLNRQGVDLFEGYEALGNTLFVNASEEKEIQ